MTKRKNQDYGLIPESERAERAEFIRSKVLSFLYYEPYTTAKVVQTLAQYKTIQGANKLLRSLEAQGFVKRQRLTNLAGRGMSLWGITGAGCAAIYDPEKSFYKRTRGFKTDSIYLTTLDHLNQMQLLKCRIINSKRNISILYIDKNIWKDKVPDVLAKLVLEDGNESIIAYEVELTIKSEKRYKEIIGDYKPHIKKNQCDYIFWVSDTESKRDKLSNIFKRNNGSSHHKFRTLEELKL